MLYSSKRFGALVEDTMLARDSLLGCIGSAMATLNDVASTKMLIQKSDKSLKENKTRERELR
ncbi:unnamed protein product [Anisakis simplex]|uniref:Uncharacterized protein n=1 Tax=Anisakis simplex TaxID=6269 RepID=A0A3P6R4Y3_ANISI|nr:unnamed protein product [Anisakis simplex]